MSNQSAIWFVTLDRQGMFNSASKTEPTGSHVGRYVYSVEANDRGEAITKAKSKRASGASSDTTHGLR